VLFTEYVEEDGMHRSCSTHMREIHTKFCFENVKGRNHLCNTDVDGRIILKCVV